MPESDKLFVDAAMWGRAPVCSLEITGDLFGAAHTFDHDGYAVTITTPEVELDDQMRPVGKSAHWAEYSSGFADNATVETNSYAIAHVEAAMNLVDPLYLPQSMLEVSPKRPDLAGEKLTTELDKLSIDFEQRLADAVGYWKSVVRWITGSRAMDAPDGVAGRESEPAFGFRALIAQSSRKRFWTPIATMTLTRRTEITAEMWRRIGAALQTGREAPVWSRFLDQAYNSLQMGDARNCVLSCAVACETIAKNINTQTLFKVDGKPNPLATRKRPFMADILADWSMISGIDDNVSGRCDVDNIMQIRNDVMHAGGTSHSINRQVGLNAFRAATIFVATAEPVYYRRTSSDDPRLLKI